MARGADLVDPAARLWARRETRRRPWSLLALGLICGLTAAVALSSFAGARRADSAYERVSEETLAADAVVFASQVDIFAPDWSEVAALPYVESAGSFGIPFVRFVDGPPGIDLDLGVFSVPFGTWRTGVDRPVILEGRAPDPSNPHEMLATPESRAYGIAVGDHYTIGMPSPEQIETVDLFSEPQGERVDMEVVGIGRSTFELAVIPGDDAGFVSTPAFAAEYGQGTTYIDNLMVRFKPGEGSVAQLEADARAIFDSPRMPVLDARAVSKRVTNGTGLEATGLALFGLAVALTGAVLVGQALTRSVRAGAVDVPTLRGLGFTRNDAATALVLPHLLSIAFAAVVAVVGSIALSPRFPIGLSRRVDPDVGIHADWLVIGLGTAALVVLLTATSVAAAQRAARPQPSPRRPTGSRLVTRLAGFGAPPPMVVGAGFALEPGRDRRALPTRPALMGVVVGVIGVIGAQTFLAGIDDAIDRPERFGVTWDLELESVDFSGVSTMPAATTAMEASSDVVASAISERGLVVIDGTTQPTYAIVPRQGDLDYAILRGRGPLAPGEIALGPESAKEYDVGIGDTVEAAGDGGTSVSMTVVGIALLPTTPHSSYDQGAWVLPSDLEALEGAAVGELRPGDDPLSATPPILPTAIASVRTGADPAAVATTVNQQLDPAVHELHEATEPLDLTNLRNVRSLPLLFALFTLVLAIGTVAHVSASVLRRRGTELAVLRALGMTPRDTRVAFGWQATTLSVIGLVVGIPVGMILGRVLWRIVADLTPLVFSPPVAVVALVVALPVTLLLANAIAVVPGRRAARVAPGELLTRE